MWQVQSLCYEIKITNKTIYVKLLLLNIIEAIKKIIKIRIIKKAKGMYVAGKSLYFITILIFVTGCLNLFLSNRTTL
ncbi:hypothetical protein AMR41_22305 [Hapalosiphon sp. MRB220]|nr:hypothetical protein AMR41_22305 [Hapalosiphon sp. MRB220]